ncbi:aldo/keto reductase [Leptolyngbyaceae cyanobacterium CCMR0082]|uniref:Aldo/keto reductase n=2 Tax=Adonisia turfae TaxID=2950184 RepID=A0A6M0SLM4_9CYAN|nr:aldo/keto reductase [Adonisia turfae]MDV3348051.1 aldo/keto reductase [Leptothoe sp. LEGE 181152]NEZ58159.1 aldo/keto reductase [Adonisia turfae CCMR0081]NEZ68202.1 aldo/keto reductase [Adonisia turfae CCMR0082]
MQALLDKVKTKIADKRYKPDPLEISRESPDMPMAYTILGNTNLKVSVAGLGGGGYSRLGQGYNRPVDESIAIVHRALDWGINLLDTAESYGTEHIIGEAIAYRGRSNLVLSTQKKISVGGRFRPRTLIRANELEAGLNNSLKKLNTDYIDIYHLHGVRPSDYDYVKAEFLPALLKFKDAGKVRFIGITEGFASDPEHKMLSRAVEDDCWDVFMLGFNILNQSARERVLRKALAKNIGILSIFAVRRVLASPATLKPLIDEMIEKSLIDPHKIDLNEPLGFLMKSGEAESLADASYRFCRHEPGVHSVLFGTGDGQHLEENIRSLLRGPLSQASKEMLNHVFGHIDQISGQTD